MNINFTLVIQLFNFFIAYILIERLLVRPAIALVKAEDEEHFKLSTLISFNEKQLEQKQFDINQEWRTIQDIFAKSMPRTVSLKSQAIEQVLIKPQMPDASLIDKTVQESTAFLVSEVGRE